MIKEAQQLIENKGVKTPEVGIVLGTGLSKLSEHIKVEVEIPYEEIPYFPEPTVEFHSGKLIYGEINGKKVIAMNGRFHYYEGYGMKQITFPIRVLYMLGIKTLLISNACGAMNLDIKKGDIMLLDDHINLQPENPLIGENEEKLGPRFVDMSKPYSPEVNDVINQVAKEKDITLHEGVYVAVTGPQLETRAEYRYLRTIGADVVGMSTVPEVIAANHMSLPVSAISVITDECDPDNLQPIDIDEVIEVAGKAEKKLTEVYGEVIGRL
ncbi:MAG: purine-nucleoside phosphorylase [Flavobacteriales bacterium]